MIIAGQLGQSDEKMLGNINKFADTLTSSDWTKRHILRGDNGEFRWGSVAMQTGATSAPHSAISVPIVVADMEYYIAYRLIVRGIIP
jgi:hypothetical protein